MKTIINKIEKDNIDIIIETPYDLNVKVYETKSGYRIEATEISKLTN